MFNTIVSFACICYVSVCIWRIKYYYYYYYYSGDSHMKIYNHILNIRDASMFHNRVINFSNKLPDSVALAASISSFKRQLSSFVVNVGFEYFSVNYSFYLSLCLRYCHLLL